MKLKTIISTLGAEYEHIIETIKKFGGDKLIIFYDSSDNEVHSAIGSIKALIPPSFIPSEFHSLNPYNISEASKIIRNVIATEFKGGNKVYVNVSGGEKTLAFAAQLASYIEYDKVECLFVISLKNRELINLPIIRWLLSLSKQNILGCFYIGVNDAREIADRVRLSDSMTYKHIKELIEEGYLIKNGERYELTEIGKMFALLREES